MPLLKIERKLKMTKLKLGQKVEDSITGYKGVAVARTMWLNGCERIAVQGPLGKDGMPPEEKWFDITQLVKSTKKKKSSGGPTPTPQRHTDPIR